MNIPRLSPIRFPARPRWGFGIAVVLLATAALATWTISLLHRETARANAPTRVGVEIPVLDRALLSELSSRVPR